jgi:hypothetical protein
MAPRGELPASRDYFDGIGSLNTGAWVKLTPNLLAMVAEPIYFWGGRHPFNPSGDGTLWYETVTLNQMSKPLTLATAAECHGVRGFVATVLWPPGTTAGAVAVYGADQDDQNAYGLMANIVFPAVNAPSPLGLVLTFMRLMVTTMPVGGTPANSLAARMLLR